MSISLSLPTPSGRIGPGYRFSVNNDDVGPIPLDDFVSVILQVPTSFLVVLYTFVTADGLHDVGGVLGVNRGRPWDTFVEGNQSQVAQGDPVLVNIQWQHAGGTFVGSAAVSGSWTYDPVGGLGAQMAKLHQGSAGGGGSLDDVLAAVRRSFT